MSSIHDRVMEDKDTLVVSSYGILTRIATLVYNEFTVNTSISSFDIELDTFVLVLKPSQGLTIQNRKTIRTFCKGALAALK